MTPPAERERPVVTWRGPSRGDRSPLGADRSSDKWVATVVVLLLIGALGWAVVKLLPGRPAKIVWAVFPIDFRQGPGDASGEEASFVQTLKDVLTSDEQDEVNSLVDWSSLEISQAGVIEGQISQLLKKLKNKDNKELILRKEDTFVLYLAGTGFTRDGKARIRFSNAVVDDLATESFALDGLLAGFKECRAGTKLLILDVDVPGFDPRVGVVFNEFPYCAAQAIAAADSDVWVLLSHRDFEIPGEYASHRPTLLHALVANALHGQAVPKGGYLELRELYKYVTTQCRDQFAGHSVDGQRPVLMRGRVGAFEVSAVDESGLKLAMVRTASDEQPADASTVGAKLEKKAEQKVKSGASRLESQLKSNVQRATRIPQIAGRYVAQLSEPAAKRDETIEKSAPKADQPPTTDASSASADENTKQPKAAPDSPAAKEAASAKEVPDSEADAKKAEAVPAADGGDISPESAMRAALVEMWTAWDELQDPARQFWAPIDACPLAWRALQQKLIERARSWRRWGDPVEIADRAQKVTEDLRRLRTYVQGTSGPPTFSNQELSMLFDDVEKVYSRAKTNWPRADAVTNDSGKQRDDAIRTYNGALFFLPDYASWHARTSLGKVGATSPFDQIAGKLTAVVANVSTLHEELAKLDGQLFERPADLQRPTDNLKDSLRALRTEIEQDVARAIDWNDLAGEKRVASLLDSSLLTATQRDKLLAHWLARKNIAPTAVATSESEPSARPDATVPVARQWARVDELIKIQAAIIRPFDKGAADDLITLSKKAVAAGTDDGKREASRAAATALHGFYGGLRQRIQAGLKSASPDDPAASAVPGREAIRQVLGLIRLVDTRDIDSIAATEPYAVWNEFDIRVKTIESKLEFASELLEVALEIEQPQELTIAFRAGAIAQGVTAAVRCEPPNTIEIIRHEVDKDPVCQEKVPFPVPVVNVSAGENQQLRLALRALRNRASDEGPVKVMVTLAADGTVLPSTECRILCQLPQPDHIGLIARKTGSKTDAPKPEPSLDDDIVCLRSFPNRTTAYEFFLTNRADREKSVSVRLFSLPAVPGQTWAPGRLRSHDNQLARDILRAVFVDGSPDKGIREDFAQQHLLAEVDDITIQPGNIETPLSFLPSPKEGEEAKPNADAATKKAETPAEKDISHGLLCWITDKGGSGRSWAKWIELPVLHPREYLSVLASSFRGGQITVEVELNKSAGFSWSDQEPVRVTWTGVASIDLSDKIPKGSLKQGDLAADGKKQRIYLAVDDYPRAFVLDVPRQPTEEASDPAFWKDRFASIRMERVTAQFPQPAGPNDPRPPEDVRVINGLQETIAFKPCEKLLIEMAADVPSRAFAADYDPSQAIRLTVGGQEKAGPFFADRDAKIFFVDCGERLTLRAQVRDYLVTLPPGGQDMSIAVEASLPRQEPAVDPARLTIQIDGKSPSVTSDRLSYEIDLVQPLSIQLTLEDTLSGIDRVLYGIVADSEAVDEAKLEAKLKPNFLVNSPKREQITLRIPTAGAGLEKGKRYSLELIVYDRAGNKTRDTLKLQVHEPAPPRPVGDIVGTVDYNGASLDNWTLQIDGPGGFSKRVKHGEKAKDGSFQANKDTKKSEYRFKDLSPGTYTITVKGTPTGRTFNSKPVQVTVEAGKESGAVPITEFE